ncbi:beta-ketoacyl synthase N-terminal-like domain-containing protein [Lutispora saccharofermentans]|uniref:Beta-ketoacyl synthase-like N-terminal domain-containing protein n=1 Tax=Lutispora saccharofermentans TaxID=3024236 RepID=A0ABT1NIL2_9FIRM|nr:hypothetical protein [Lutispora saccharofermentans]
MTNRVFITGVGALLGSVKDSFSNGYIINDELCEKINAKYQTRSLDRVSKLLLAASELSLTDSSVEIDKNVHKEYGLFVGTKYGALNSIHSFDSQAVAKGALTVKPTQFPNTVLNAPACQVGIQLSIEGPIYTVCNGTNASLDAIGLAYNHVKTGHVDAAFVIGADEISELQIRIHHVDENVHEASGALVLQTNEDIRHSNCDIEIVGYYSQSIAYDNRPDNTEVISNIIKTALRGTDLRTDKVACIKCCTSNDQIIESLITNVIHSLNYNGLYFANQPDYMGAVGIILTIESVYEMRKCTDKGIAHVIINLSSDNISVLIIKKH